VTARAVEIVLAFVIVVAAGCGGGSPSSRSDKGGKTTVDAAFYPLAWAAEQVGDADGVDGKTVDLLRLGPLLRPAEAPSSH
jgi:hypothetical protein